MGGATELRELVGDGIDRLRERFGSFTVNQTTVSVSTERYRRARERTDAGVANVYVLVRNGDGEVLHVEREGEWEVPQCVGRSGDSLAERARALVREETGVACTVEGVESATIAGVRHEGDRDAPPVFRLVVLLDAEYQRGTPTAGAWRDDDPATPEFV